MVLNEEFSPTLKEVAAARRIVKAYEIAIVGGKGAITVDGKMVDVPIAERAQRLLVRYERIKEKTSVVNLVKKTIK